MDSGKRKTEKYSFKDPKIDELMSLILEIMGSTDFRKKYGSIMSLMKLRMKGVFSPLWSNSMIRCIDALLSVIIS